MSKQEGLLPRQITLVGWEEEVDLRTVRRTAKKLAQKYKLNTGEAILVSGSRYTGGRRFAFVVMSPSRAALVVQPPTDSERMLLSLMLRASETLAELRGG